MNKSRLWSTDAKNGDYDCVMAKNGDYDCVMETKLKKEMPYLIFSKYLKFANTRNYGNFILDGIWEIKANHFQLFSLHYP